MHRTMRILIALAAGIACGLFFGESCAILEPLANAFIKLMQMAVIPYVVVSVIAGIGGLSRTQAETVAWKGGLLMACLWALGVALFFSMQFAFPHRVSASFYSAADLSRPEPVSLVETFIPANPFKALADGILPAIVLFSIFLGAALIGVRDRKPLLDILTVLSAALTRVMTFVISLIPYGIFIIAANAAGTISLDTLYQLQFFCESYIVLALLLTLFILPMLVSLFTDLRVRDVLSACGSALILAFSTQKTFIVLPLIEQGVRQLFARRDGKENKTGVYAEVLIPIAYNFPTYGDFAPFLFVLFVGWLYHTPLGLWRQLHCAAAGVFSLFGSARAAVPFLLTLARLPEDANQLYHSLSPINSHFGAALSCMFLFAFTACCVAIMSGTFRPRARRMLATALALVVAMAAAIGGLRMGFAHLLRNAYLGDAIMAGMKLPGAADGKRYLGIFATVFRTSEEFRARHPEPEEHSEDMMENIRQRRVLRVGYNEDALPFTFFNRGGDLVGYDVQTAHELASFAGIPGLEFIPVTYDALDEALREGRCDIVMAGVVITPERLHKMRFSSSYMTSHLAFVVPDHRKEEFARLDEIIKRSDVLIATLKGSAYEEILPHIFPRAGHVRLDSQKEFFAGGNGDALLTTAEEGAPWTLLHPSYCVASFGPGKGMMFLHAYAVAKDGDDSFLSFVNAFLETERAHGNLQRKYDYWVLGKNPYVKTPRWSVIRDVLHWTN